MVDGARGIGVKTGDDADVFTNTGTLSVTVAPEARAKWKNVFYGKDNLAPPEKLYWNLKAEGSQ